LLVTFPCRRRDFLPAARTVYYTGRSPLSQPGARVMTITVEATYENGVLKPAQPLPFQEREKVQVTVQAAVSRARQTAGLLRWTGEQRLVGLFIMAPELAPAGGQRSPPTGGPGCGCPWMQIVFFIISPPMSSMAPPVPILWSASSARNSPGSPRRTSSAKW